MFDDPRGITALADAVKRRPDGAALATELVAGQTAFLVEQPLSQLRARDVLERDVIIAEPVAGQAEHVQRELFHVTVVNRQRRHRRARHHRGRITKMPAQPCGTAMGADRVQFRANRHADPVQLVTTDAAQFLEQRAAACQPRRAGNIVRQMTLGAGRLEVFPREHRLFPVLDMAVGGFPRRGAALSLVTNRAPEFLERMLVVGGMIRQRLFHAGVAGIFDGQVTGDAAIDAAEFRQHDLLDLDREPGRRRALGVVGGAGQFPRAVFFLPVFPFP